MKIKLFILYAFLPFLVNAQNFKTTRIGEPDYDFNNANGLYISGGVSAISTGNGYMGISVESKRKMNLTFRLNKIHYSVTLFRYDKAYNLIKKNEISTDENEMGPIEPRLVLIHHLVYLIYYNQSDSGINVNIASINETDLGIQNVKKLLSLSLKNITAGRFSDFFSYYDLKIETSPDGNHLLFMFHSGINNDLYYASTDSRFNVLKTAMEKMEDYGDIRVNNVFVENDGSFYGSFFHKKHSTRHQCLFACTPGAPFKSVAVEENENLHYRQTFLVNGKQKDQLQFCGTTVNGDGNITGAIYQTLNKADFKVLDEMRSGIPQELLDRCDKDKYGWVNKKSAAIYGSFEFILNQTNNGSIVLAGTLKRFGSRLGRNNDFITLVITGPILVLVFAEKNIVFRRIPKVEEGGSQAFFPFAYKDKVILFYQDNEENLKTDMEKDKIVDCGKCVQYLIAAKVSSDGTISRSIVGTEKEPHALFNTNAEIIDESSFTFRFNDLKFRGGYYAYKDINYLMEIKD